MPFVEGRLRKQPVTFFVTTECAHCARPIHIEMDDRMNWRVTELEADPLVFMPMVDFDRLSGPSIIDDF